MIKAFVITEPIIGSRLIRAEIGYQSTWLPVAGSIGWIEA
jgi:hypothetical protein